MRSVLPAVLLLLALTPVALADGPAPTTKAARYEVDFLTGMIDHHSMAVHSGQMCIEKAVHDDLRSLCGSIVATQRQEIDRMQSWLGDWYGMSHEPRTSPKGEKTMERLGRLDGGEFEIHFMEMMVKHHEAAIREAEACLQDAEHEELRALCQDIIDSQSREAGQLRTWLCTWYGRCKGT